MSSETRKARRKSVRDLTKKDFKKSGNPTKGNGAKEKFNVIDENYFTEELYDKLSEYNKNINNVSEAYRNLRFVDEFLLRVYCNELVKNDDGLILPVETLVDIPTRAGVGSVGSVLSPYPYTAKAVVIQVPNKDLNQTGIEVGDIVYLKRPPVAVTVGAGDDVIINVPSAFTIDEWQLRNPPTDPMNENFGFIVARGTDIRCVIV